MTNLLRADFYRIRKSKLTLVMLILVMVLPLILSLMYFGLQGLMDFLDDLGGEAATEFAEGFQIGLEVGGMDTEGMDYSSLFGIELILSGTFNLADNLGLILPIFAGLLVCGDLTSGTLRAKMISGSSRTKVYLSHMISSGIFSAVMAVIYTAFTLLFAFLFFDYSEEITGEVVLRFVRWAVLGILTFVFASTVSTFLALSTGSTGGTIIFTLVFCIVLQLVASLCTFLADREAIRDFLYLIPTYGNVHGLDLSWKEFGISCGAFCLFGALNGLLGILLFRQKELK